MYKRLKIDFSYLNINENVKVTLYWSQSIDESSLRTLNVEWGYGLRSHLQRARYTNWQMLLLLLRETRYDTSSFYLLRLSMPVSPFFLSLQITRACTDEWKTIRVSLFSNCSSHLHTGEKKFSRKISR